MKPLAVLIYVVFVVVGTILLLKPNPKLEPAPLPYTVLIERAFPYGTHVFTYEGKTYLVFSDPKGIAVIEHVKP